MAWAHRFVAPSGIPAGGEGLWGAARSVKGDTRPDFSADTQPPAALKSAGHMEAKEYREELRKRRAKVLQVYDRVLDKALVSDDASVLMAGARLGNAIDDRLDGKPNQSVSGPEGGPQVTEVRYSWSTPPKRPDDGA